MITMITELVPPLSTAFMFFFDKYDFFLKKNKKEREELSAWLIKVGDKLKDLADELSGDRYPHGVCGEMRVYASEIRDMLRGYVDERDVLELEDLLMKCTDIERTYYELKQMPEEYKRADIGTIYFVAGTFIGRGEILKIK